jgi:methylenetetrahydrofolate dehydrogenase (NADP+) / methenyltetrahydrofolate cyclohydrolase
MKVDGVCIAEEILKDLKEKVASFPLEITCAVFIVGNHYATEKFVALKQKKAEQVGIKIKLFRFLNSVTGQELHTAVSSEAHNKSTQAIIVQLPLPQHINMETILSAVPSQKDVDMLGTESRQMFQKGKNDIFPPVVGAIREILEKEHIRLQDTRVVVVGNGKLVGEPAAVWARQQGAHVDIVDETMVNIQSFTEKADVIISGAGVSNLIKPHMIQNGVVLLDAGTSELGGKLSGDIDPVCADIASLYTPVPGGIGPITVAVLLRNIVTRALN